MKQIQKLARSLFENPQDSLAPSEQNKATLWLMLIVAVATVLRFYGLTSESLWYDEANSVFLSDYAAHCSQLFNAEYNNDPPLFLILLLFWRQLVILLPDSIPVDWWLRLLPCLFSILVVPAVYIVTKTILLYRPTEEDFSDNSASVECAALFCSFLVAISPFHRFYAQELRNYSLLTLLAALTLWFFILALQKNRFRYWFLLTIVLSLSFWNHFFAAWFFIVLNLYMLLTFFVHKKRYLPWAFSQIAAGLLCLPALYLAWQVSQIIDAITVQWIPPPDIKTLLITFKAFFAGYSPRSFFYWPLFLLTGLLTIFGLWALRRRYSVLLLLFLWTAFAMTASALLWSYRDFSYFELRLFIWSALSAATLVARGWASLKPRLRLSAGALLLLMTLPLLYDSTVHALHPVPQHRLGVRYKVDSKNAAAYLSRNAFSEEPVYHASHLTLSPFRFYLPEHPQIHLCRTQEEQDGFFAAYPNKPHWLHLDFQPYLWVELKDKPKTFWWVRSWWEPFEVPDHIFDLQKEISERYEAMEEVAFYGITMVHYHRKTSASFDLEGNKS